MQYKRPIWKFFLHSIPGQIVDTLFPDMNPDPFRNVLPYFLFTFDVLARS